MADLSNNPFVDHSSSAASRYPSIDGVSPPQPGSQYTSWAQPQQTGYAPSPQPQAAYGQQPGFQQQYQAPPQQQFQPTGFGGGLQSPLGAPQLQSSFFPPQQQQFAPQPTGYGSAFGQPQYTGYGQPQQQQGYAQQQQYPAGYGGGFQQQQQPAPTPYGGNTNLAAFDPYANPSQFQQQQQPGQSAQPGGPAPPGKEHPRMFVQAHKAELEQWDAYAWKQALNAFDALAAAWEAHKRQLDARISQLGSAPGAAGGFFAQPQGYGGYGGYNPQAQELERINRLAKDAENNVGTVHAAKFQMTEVQGSYRHSSDAASKRRVREATNAALTNLPDWPPVNF